MVLSGGGQVSSSSLLVTNLTAFDVPRSLIKGVLELIGLHLLGSNVFIGHHLSILRQAGLLIDNELQYSIVWLLHVLSELVLCIVKPPVGQGSIPVIGS